MNSLLSSLGRRLSASCWIGDVRRPLSSSATAQTEEIVETLKLNMLYDNPGAVKKVGAAGYSSISFERISLLLFPIPFPAAVKFAAVAFRSRFFRRRFAPHPHPTTIRKSASDEASAPGEGRPAGAATRARRPDRADRSPTTSREDKRSCGNCSRSVGSRTSPTRR